METPFGWEWAGIGDLVPTYGVFRDGDWIESKDQDPAGDVRLIQLADIGDGMYNDRSSRFLTYSRAQELKCTFLMSGDLLIARMPDPLGRACIFPGDSKPAVTAVDVCIVRTCTDVGHRWLMHMINSPQSRKKIAALQSGSTRKRISRKNLATILLPIPPLVEQRAIVAKIEELFSELDKGVEQLQTVKQQLNQYRQAVLKAAFEGKLTAEWRAEQQAVGNLPDADELLEQIKREREERYQQQLQEWKQAVVEWEEAGGRESGRKKPRRPGSPKEFQPLAESDLLVSPALPEPWQWVYLGVFAEIVGGVTKGRKLVGRTVVHLPYLRVANVQDGYLDLMEVKEISIPIEEKRRYLLKPGDVLYTEGGDRDKLGRGTMWRGELDACIHQNHVFRARPVAAVDSSYLAYFSQTRTARSYFMRHAKQTVNLASINMTLLSHLPVPIPSMEEQRQIVDEIESRLSVLAELDKAVDQALEQAEALRQSILKKAFEGRLLTEAELAAVRSDPEYEPADKLLERIRAAR